VENASQVNPGMVYTEIPYEDCESVGYSSGVEIEGVGRLYSKIFQNIRHTEYWFVDKNGAVKHIEEKNVDALLLSLVEPSMMKAVMEYLNTGKYYS